MPCISFQDKIAVMPHRQTSFVLILVLALISIAGTAVAIVSSLYSSAVIRHAAKLEQLQTKWGRISCQNVWFPLAEKLLLIESVESGNPSIAVKQHAVLGGIEFEILLSDEQAKANVNHLLGAYGKESLMACLARLQKRSRVALPVKLTSIMVPDKKNEDDSNDNVLISSPSQVFAFKHPSCLLPSLEDDAHILSLVTLWGDGRLNILRAPADSIREIAQGLLTESDTAFICEARSRFGANVEDMLRTLSLDDASAAQLADLFVEKSRCHSMWIVATTNKRKHYSLYVRQEYREKAKQSVRFWGFEW